MEQSFPLKIIAEIRSDFPTKFGIPRQSGLVPELEATVVFRPEYRVPEALRGIEGYSHLWLLWEFSETRRGGSAPRGWAATAGWGSLPAGRPFGPIPSGFPACGCWGWSSTPSGARCCALPGPT